MPGIIILIKSLCMDEEVISPRVEPIIVIRLND